MEFTSGFAVQLGVAFLAGVLLFAAAYLLPEKPILGFLILLIPWQIVTSRYGSMNMVLTYLIGFALLMKGRLKLFPLLPYLFVIMMVYFISMSQALRLTYKDHFLYIVTVASDFVLFYMVYNFFRRTGDYGFAIKLLIWTNVLVTAYSALLLAMGSNTYALFGISEFGLAQNREDGRLMGTFAAAGVNAEFYTLQILILGFLSVFEKNRRNRFFLLALGSINFGMIIASGSRGSFLTTMAGIGLFIFMFRKELGAASIARIVSVGAVGFIAITFVIINYTNYNVLFDRLAETEFDDSGIPDTRQAIVNATFERIPNKFVIGHGPQIKLIDEADRRIKGYTPLGGHPHNLYLFLLYTTGVIGLIAYLAFFAALFQRFMAANRIPSSKAVLNRIPKLGILLLIIFLIDQMKIEFLRSNLGDYQHYLYTLWAILLAFTDTFVRRIYRQRYEDRLERVAEEG